MKKRILSALVAFAMVVSILPTTIFAVGTLDTTLDLTTSGDTSDTGYTWVSSTKTLTITSDGLEITSSGDGIIVPAGTIIVLNGDLTINATDGSGIYCDDSSGNITIEGTKTLTITTTGDSKHGIHSVYGSISIKDANRELTVDITTTGNSAYGICAERSSVDIAGAKVTIDTQGTNSSYGIRASGGDVSITNSANIDITTVGSNANGIYVAGSTGLTITDSTVKVETASGVTAIYNQSGVLTISGTSDVETNNKIYSNTSIAIAGSAKVTTPYLEASGAIEIKDTATVTASYYVYAKSTLTIATGATLNAVVRWSDNTRTLYGDVEITSTAQASTIFGSYALNFDDGSNLTIAEDAVVNWTSNNITWTNASITNNGNLLLDSNDIDQEGVDALGITGDGSILLVDSSAALLIGDIVLGASIIPAYADYGYTWLLDSTTGEYTLTFDKDTVVVGDIIITGADGVINSENDITVLGDITSTNDVTITGDGTVTVDIIDVDGDVTIEDDATVTVDEIYADGDVAIGDNATVETYLIYTNAALTIDGDANVTTDEINAGGDVAIGDNATVNTEYIETNANLTIEGNATVTAGRYLWANDDITIGDDATVDACDISADGDITIDGNATVTAEDICTDEADGDITIDGNATVDADYIYTYEDDSDITIGGNATVDADYIYTYEDDSDITIGGDATVTATGYIWAENNLSINDTATVTVLYYAGQSNTATSVSVATTANFTGIASSTYDDNNYYYNDVVYGDVVVADTYQADNMFYDGTLAFAEGSSLTIAAGAEVDWTDYDITWDNADITNNGIIYLDSNDYGESDIAALGIEGDGFIVIDDGSGIADGNVYTNSGETAAVVSDDIILGATEVDAGAGLGYTWLEGDTGVYTLTFDESALVTGDIYLGYSAGNPDPVADTGVTAAVIDLTNSVTVGGTIQSRVPLTITGDETLTAQGISGSAGGEEYAEITFTIEEGATVNAYSMEWLGEVIVNGDFVVVALMATDLTVNNGATVEITGIEVEDVTVSLVLLGFFDEPTLNLGSNISILAPTGSAYIVGSASDYDELELESDYLGTITTDGAILASDLSNMATGILIGATPSSAAQTFTITCIAGTGGYFTCGSTATARIGEMAGFTIVCEDGYVISDVKVDGVSVGAVSYYVMTNILSDRTIEATFALAGSTASTAPTTGDDGSNAADDVTPDANTGTGGDDADANADASTGNTDENNADADADSSLVESLATTSAINTVWMLGGMAAVLVLAGGAFFLFKRRELED